MNSERGLSRHLNSPSAMKPVWKSIRCLYKYFKRSTNCFPKCYIFKCGRWTALPHQRWVSCQKPWESLNHLYALTHSHKHRHSKSWHESAVSHRANKLILSNNIIWFHLRKICVCLICVLWCEVLCHENWRFPFGFKPDEHVCSLLSWPARISLCGVSLDSALLQKTGFPEAETSTVPPRFSESQ